MYHGSIGGVPNVEADVDVFPKQVILEVQMSTMKDIDSITILGSDTVGDIDGV
jgi:hypothetical protein